MPLLVPSLPSTLGLTFPNLTLPNLSLAAIAQAHPICLIPGHHKSANLTSDTCRNPSLTVLCADSFPHEMIRKREMGLVAHHFCHLVDGKKVEPGGQLKKRVENLAGWPMELEYLNTGDEPWEVDYEACIEDCGRIQETCGDGEGSEARTGGGIVIWEDGVLTINVRCLE